MKLNEYLTELGDEKAHELFTGAGINVKLRTIEAWRRKERTPTSSKATQIVKLTNGLVKLEDIYEG